MAHDDIRLLDKKGVCELIGVSESTLLRNVSRGLFPKPLRMGRRLVRWRLQDIRRWLDKGCPRLTEN